MADKRRSFGPFVLDRERQALLRDGEPLSIGHRGYLILEALLDANGETVSKTTLLEHAWPGVVVEEANLTVQIGALRKAMGSDGETLIVTVPRAGYRLVQPAGSPAALQLDPAVATIAVMPFANLSGNADQEYFADGMVDELITALSRFKSFAVVSRTSTFAYKDKSVDVREAAHALGVRYILEGAVRRAGDRLRVSAQLIDGGTGVHLWAERFDGTLADIFAFQDAITEGTVGRIEPEIRKTEIEGARRKPPNSLVAHDLFLKSLPLVYGTTKEDYVAALALLERATALDPAFSAAIAYAAWTVEKLAALSYLSEPDARQRAVPLAHKALATGRDDPVVRAIAGWVLFSLDPDLKWADLVRHALEANPNNLVALNLGATTNFITGAFDAAFQCYARAYRLSPGAPDIFWSLTGMGWVEIERGNDPAALEWFGRSLTASEWTLTRMGIVAALALLGRTTEARSALESLLAGAPQLSFSAGTHWWRNGGWPRMHEGLRQIGFPEGDTRLVGFVDGFGRF